MSRNVTDAAGGSSRLSQDVTSVAAVAGENASASRNTSEAAVELSQRAVELQGLVANFHL